MSLDSWQEKHPSVQIDTSMVTMPSREALRAASRDAYLVVVGRRDVLGPRIGALLQEAVRPVAVVPAR